MTKNIKHIKKLIEKNIIEKKFSSLKVSLILFRNNYINFINETAKYVENFRNYILENYDESDKNKVIFPTPLKEHEESLILITTLFINLVDSYKIVLEIVLSLKEISDKDQKKLPNYIDNFLHIVNNNKILMWHKLDNTKTDGFYVVFRNGFTHEIILNTKFTLKYPGFPSDFDLFLSINKENPKSSLSEIKNKIEEKKEQINKFKTQVWAGNKYKQFVQVEPVMLLHEFSDHRTHKIEESDKVFYIFKESFELFFVIMEDVLKIINELDKKESN